MLLSLHILLIKNRIKDERETKTLFVFCFVCVLYIYLILRALHLGYATQQTL